MEIQVSKPINLEGAYNVRDCGVYQNKNGKKLKERQVLRADGLYRLTERDRKLLVGEYSVKAVIDLRSEAEARRMPCVWEASSAVKCYHIPLLDHMQSDGFRGKLPESLAELYQGLLAENTREFAEVFRLIGKYRNDCVIFNCTAGKDRTGVTAMLLLSLASVPDETIIKDYAASERYLAKLFGEEEEKLDLKSMNLPSFLFRSDPSEMKKTLHFFKAQFGTAEEYLRGCGLFEDEIAAAREKLVPSGVE